MEPDRSTWGAQDYANALNNAATPEDLLMLVEEVNEKWAAVGDDGTQIARSRPSQYGSRSLRL